MAFRAAPPEFAIGWLIHSGPGQAPTRDWSRLAGLLGGQKRVDLHDDFLERGFQLAYFIVGNRVAAIQILVSAINKLKTQCSSERKKNYWRDKHLKSRITRIARADCDTFQWLIYFESDRYEQDQEQSGRCTNRDMVLRYIKCLVRITSGMSSFYVNIGLNRLLYNYGTPELQKLYESLTEHYLGPDEYRRVKGVLLDRLQARFGKFLAVRRTEHGEVRFVAAEDQANWAGLARNCLASFTPWSTTGNCPIPPNFDPLSHDLASSLSRNSHQKMDQNAMETRRCHAFIEPGCFNRLSNGLHLGSPDNRLAIPKFTMKNENKNQDKAGCPPQSPSLTEQERSQIRKSVAAEAERRNRALPQALRVTVDGVEAARLQLDRRRDFTFDLPESAKLIEIWTEHEGQDLLLATHLIAYKDSDGVSSSFAEVPIPRAGKLTLAIRAAAQGSISRGGVASLSFHPASSIAAKILFPAFAQRFGLAPIVSAALAVLLAIGWVVNWASVQRQLEALRATNHRLQTNISAEEATQATLEQRLARAVPADKPASYRLFPDIGITRGGENPPFPVVVLPSRLGLIALQLPLESSRPHTYTATLTVYAATEEILVENRLQSTATSTGPIVEFSVPSNFLQSRGDYTVHLWRGSTRAEEIDSFTFHVK
jgi:hypothetical protein